MGHNAPTSTRATSAGVGANIARATCGNTRVASVSGVADARFTAYVALTARASLLRSTPGVAMVAPPSNTASKRTAFRGRLTLR
jgi:hypothetical protein